MKRQRRQRINLKDDERKTLQSLVQKHTAKQSVVVRAKIILLADEGMQHQEIARELSIRNNTVTTWIARWRDLTNKSAEDRLQDSPRPGAPDKFTPEQLCQIIAIVCEKPEDHGRPVTHWTHWGSGQQGRESCGVKVPTPSVTRFRTASISTARGGNKPRYAWK